MTNAPPLRSLHVILFALATGVSIFAAVVVWMRLTGQPLGDADTGRLVVLVGIATAVMEVPVYLVLRGQFLTRAREQKSESLAAVRDGRVPPPLQALAILGGALAEGVGLLGVVALLLGAPWYALALPAVAVVLILAQLPSRERLERMLRGA